VGGRKCKINLVPLPSSVSKVTVPPNDSVKRLTTAKPNPCPFDFVVNSGVNNLSLTSSGIPTPVSETVIIESFASLKACIERKYFYAHVFDYF
jgi:hypothetical protein